MNKYIWAVCGIFGLSACTTTVINLDKQQIVCSSESGTYTLSSKSNASDIIENCKITHQDSARYVLRSETSVDFNATITGPIHCSYHDNVLDRCQFSK